VYSRYTCTAPLALARAVPTPSSTSHPTVKFSSITQNWGKEFKGPVGLVWGMKDPLLGKCVYNMKELFPNVIAVIKSEEAGHFLQEEIPEKLSETITKVMYNSKE